MARHLEQHRRELGYPPFGRLCRVVFEDKDPGRCAATAQLWAAELKARVPEEGWRVEGASPAPLALVRGKHRFNLLIKAPPADPGFEGLLAWLVEQAQRESRPDVKIDVDPVSMM
jgi:primosomal protein N' (replication factor Y)